MSCVALHVWPPSRPALVPAVPPGADRECVQLDRCCKAGYRDSVESGTKSFVAQKTEARARFERWPWLRTAWRALHRFPLPEFVRPGHSEWKPQTKHVAAIE